MPQKTPTIDGPYTVSQSVIGTTVTPLYPGAYAPSTDYVPASPPDPAPDAVGAIPGDGTPHENGARVGRDLAVGAAVSVVGAGLRDAGSAERAVRQQAREQERQWRAETRVVETEIRQAHRFGRREDRHEPAGSFGGAPSGHCRR